MTSLDMLKKKFAEETAMEKHCCWHCFMLGFNAARDMAAAIVTREEGIDYGIPQMGNEQVKP